MRATAGITAVDLFCGVGGLTHGLAAGGIDVRAGYDLDPACRFPYEANNAASFHEADVTAVTGDELREHFEPGTTSLLAGCAPCQPFSTYSRSGRSKQRANEWQLVESFGRLVQEVQPDLVTMENVAQVGDHEVFGRFMAALRGYDVAWDVVECAELGVPQSRRRLVLIASRMGRTSLRRPQPWRRTVRETIGNLRPLQAGETDPHDRLHTASRLSPTNLARIKASRPGGTWRDWPEHLLADCHRRRTGATYPSVYGRMEWEKPAPTITTQCFGYGNGRFGHPEQDRAISLREAAMLQTFPANYSFVDEGEPVRFNHLGRLVGNAVPVRLGKYIAEMLVSHVEGVKRLSEPDPVSGRSVGPSI